MSLLILLMYSFASFLNMMQRVWIKQCAAVAQPLASVAKKLCYFNRLHIRTNASNSAVPFLDSSCWCMVKQRLSHWKPRSMAISSHDDNIIFVQGLCCRFIFVLYLHYFLQSGQGCIVWQLKSQAVTKAREQKTRLLNRCYVSDFCPQSPRFLCPAYWPSVSPSMRFRKAGKCSHYSQKKSHKWTYINASIINGSTWPNKGKSFSPQLQRQRT